MDVCCPRGSTGTDLRATRRSPPNRGRRCSRSVPAHVVDAGVRRILGVLAVVDEVALLAEADEPVVRDWPDDFHAPPHFLFFSDARILSASARAHSSIQLDSDILADLTPVLATRMAVAVSIRYRCSSLKRIKMAASVVRFGSLRGIPRC